VAIDTPIVIYFVERNERYADAIRPLFEEADRGDRRLVTSAITLLEVLVVPYRAGDATMARRYERFLGGSRGLTLVDLERPVLRAAAHLRATRGIRTPDAIQLAAGLSEQCTSFLTNDRRLASFPGLPVLQLDDLL
jgi:predicted nucleic acid-binding protein